jgi:hypothetical protein
VDPALVRLDEHRLIVDPAGRLVETPEGAAARVADWVDAAAAVDRVLGLVAQAGG